MAEDESSLLPGAAARKSSVGGVSGLSGSTSCLASTTLFPNPKVMVAAVHVLNNRGVVNKNASSHEEVRKWHWKESRARKDAVAKCVGCRRPIAVGELYFTNYPNAGRKWAQGTDFTCQSCFEIKLRHELGDDDQDILRESKLIEEDPESSSECSIV